MKLKNLLSAAAAAGMVICGIGLPVQYAAAKVSAAKAAELGGSKYTCEGAIRAGSKDGVAAFTGKYTTSWPGMKQKQGYNPSPFANEKPLFTINAQNMAKYADKMTPGEKALMKAYPKSYYMKVYPSHRDFGFPAWVCKVTKKNAVTSTIVHGGLGITGTTGSIPFPFPQNGLQAIWNVINPYRAWTEKSTYDFADVYPGGKISWGRIKFMSLNVGNNPHKRSNYQSKINAYFYQGYLKPERQAGFVAVGYQPNDFANDATRSWQYLPGLRRVREAPRVGFDYPVPPAGLRVVSDDYGFNGSPAHYNWKLIGKKEFYVPYDNFKINSPKITYKELVTPNVINQKYERYELHRVWVLEGDLKPGVRDIYSKRVLYIDEDSWLTTWADNYDGQGKLWRATYINYFYSPASESWERGVSLFNDLTSHAYEVDYLVNQAGHRWWKLNVPLRPGQFSPQAAASGGH